MNNQSESSDSSDGAKLALSLLEEGELIPEHLAVGLEFGVALDVLLGNGLEGALVVHEDAADERSADKVSDRDLVATNVLAIVMGKHALKEFRSNFDDLTILFH